MPGEETSRVYGPAISSSTSSSTESSRLRHDKPSRSTPPSRSTSTRSICPRPSRRSSTSTSSRPCSASIGSAIAITLSRFSIFPEIKKWAWGPLFLRPTPPVSIQQGLQTRKAPNRLAACGQREEFATKTLRGKHQQDRHDSAPHHGAASLTPGCDGGLHAAPVDLILAFKMISREVNRAGLAAILGLAGKENIQGEQ